MTEQRFIRTLSENTENPGELLLDLGKELCKQLGWQPGDILEWQENKDGSWTLKKTNK